MSRFIRIQPRDNVAVALEPLKAGETVLGVSLLEDIPAGHKFALTDITENENIVKYGFPIGHATLPIPAGSAIDRITRFAPIFSVTTFAMDSAQPDAAISSPNTAPITSTNTLF